MEKLLMVILMFGALAFGQQAKTPTEKPLPISHYMQKTGLLYLEDVDKMFNQALKDEAASPTELIDPNENEYGKALTSLENNIEVDITLDGDKQFLDLLKDAKSYAGIAFTEWLRTSVPGYKALPASAETAKMYPVCVAQAHDVIRAGEFTLGDCSHAKFHEAEKADKAVQEKQSEAGKKVKSPSVNRAFLKSNLWGAS